MQSASYLTEHLNWILTAWYISIIKSFNSQKWFTCNFSQQYPYIIQQTCNEITSTQSYPLEIVIMI